MKVPFIVINLSMKANVLNKTTGHFFARSYKLSFLFDGTQMFANTINFSNYNIFNSQ